MNSAASNTTNTSGSTSGPSKRVFVGNIPYEFTEEQLIEIFSQVGPVVNFRLVFDKDSGKPKGFGFCDYHDVETASSAVRNLNNYDIGNRLLRVDFAGDNSNDDNKQQSQQPQQPVGGNPTSNYSRPPPASASNMPGKPFPPQNTSSMDNINQLIGTMTKDQIYQVMEQLKLMYLKDARACHQLLLENPQLNYFLLKGFLHLDYIQDSYFNQLVNPVQMHRHQTPPMGQHMHQHPPPQQMHQPPPQHQPQPAEDNAPDLDADQQKLLYDRILTMTTEEIDQLPADQKQKILTIRDQLLSGGVAN